MFSYKIDSCLFLSQFISEAANYILELMVWVGLVWCGLRVMDQRSSLGTVLWPPTICLRIAALLHCKEFRHFASLTLTGEKLLEDKSEAKPRLK